MYVFPPMPGFSILLSLQYLRCEKGSSLKVLPGGSIPNQVFILSICNLWSSEVVKRVRHNLPNQSKLLEGEHAKRFMKPLSSPGAWGMICQSSPSFFQATCLSLILWVLSSEISVTSFLIMRQLFNKAPTSWMISHDGSYRCMTPHKRLIGYQLKKSICLDYSFKTVFLPVHISFLWYEIIPLKKHVQ